MSDLNAYKISTYKNPVSSLPDNPSKEGMTAQELKAAFDANATGEIKKSINKIIDTIVSLKGNVISLRLNSKNEIEVSKDGVVWLNPFNSKVDKVANMGLSKNDYSDAEKNKVAENLIAKHSHANKAVLDSITATNYSNWNTSYTNQHIHNNKSVIDGISSAKVTEWNGKVSSNEVIKKNNTTAFTPTANFHPATKKYVDDQIEEVIVDASNADMRKSVYDPNNKSVDIFRYVDVEKIYNFHSLLRSLGSNYKYLTKKNATSVVEEIVEISTNEVFATRITTKNSDTQWVVRVISVPYNINVRNVYTKVNGLWEGGF